MKDGKSRLRLGRRRWHSNEGQSLVEFALILPILLFVLFGIIDFGRALFTYAQASNSLRNALRYGVILGYDSGNQQYLDCTEMRNIASEGVFFASSQNVTVSYIKADSGTVLPTDDQSCDSTGEVTDSEIENGDQLNVQVTSTVDLITPFISNITPALTFTLEGQRTLVKEITLTGSLGPGGEGVFAVLDITSPSPPEIPAGSSTPVVLQVTVVNQDSTPITGLVEATGFAWPTFPAGLDPATDLSNFTEVGFGVYTWDLDASGAPAGLAQEIEILVDGSAGTPATNASDVASAFLDVDPAISATMTITPDTAVLGSVIPLTITVYVEDETSTPVTTLDPVADFNWTDTSGAPTPAFVSSGGGNYDFSFDVSGVTPVGTYPVTVEVTDTGGSGEMDTASATFDITATAVVNASMIINPDSAQIGSAPPLGITVTVIDSLLNPIDTLVSGDFTWLQLSGASVSNFSNAGGGDYTFDLDVSAVSPVGNGYVVEVLVDDGSSTDNAIDTFDIIPGPSPNPLVFDDARCGDNPVSSGVDLSWSEVLGGTSYTVLVGGVPASVHGPAACSGGICSCSGDFGADECDPSWEKNYGTHDYQIEVAPGSVLSNTLTLVAQGGSCGP